MRAPEIPPDEAERLADLYDYGILDSPAEKIFDEIAVLAAAICGTPIGAVTLVDRDRQWFKSEHGLNLGQTSRDASICGHAILERDLFEVPDTQRDDRFVDNPLLTGPPAIRFYSGSQLISDRGHAVGMLCVMDSQPRELSDAQRQALRQLAAVVSALIEAGRRTRLYHWFGALLDNITDEMLIADPDTLRYLHANRAACENLRRSLDELREMTPMDVSGSPRDSFEGYVRRLRGGERQVVFDSKRLRADGVIYPVEVRWQLLTTRGRPVILSIVQDVTERRKIEMMKDEFVSVVNHELRTPLTAIHGAIRLLETGAAGELSPMAAHLVELASQNSQRLRGIVDDILDLEKIASGRTEFDLKPLVVREVLERAAGSFEAVAQTVDVSLVVEAEVELVLRADPRRLQQVLANLISNALKFAPQSTAVRIVARALDGMVRLSVTDSGAGVPQDFSARIFERFAQANMDTNRTQGGSGLGLSIAKQMTQQMRGRIGYESRPGCTTFWVEFPGTQAI